MSETTQPQESTPAALVRMGWMRRPSGSSMFVNGSVHLMVPGQERYEARTLCGRLVPNGGIAGDRTPRLFATVSHMDESDLAEARECGRCAAAAAKREKAAR